MKKRIGVIGKTALDILVHGVDLKSIKSGATNTVDGLILELGGAALNVATAAAHKIFKREHEIEVYLYTQVCDDGLLNSKLEEHCRINEISLVNLGGVAATPRICVLVHNDNSRSRTFLCGKSDGKMSKVTLPENFANELSECDVLVLAGITPDHPVLEDDWCRVLADAKILREQKKPESPLIIAIDILLVDDLQKKNISRVYSVLSLADYFFPNSEELWQVWDYLPNSSNSRRGRGTRSSERSKNAPEDSREISDLKEICYWNTTLALTMSKAALR
jgi:sugar/nucleoside kinase (ribokinase family)